ncbi:hypothetical protein ACIQV3_29630 [Streptomyces sp. NPDC099050]|uniref:hypothetical protein n=1 Tax=Streptomyces sp. NPDC099050 TaxID=3366100 RepID=UPI003804E0DD
MDELLTERDRASLPNEPEKVQLTHQMLEEFNTGPDAEAAQALDTEPAKEPALA